MGMVTEIFLPAALFIIMMSLGLGLSTGDFRRVATQPRDFVAGVLSQMVVLPLVAFAIAAVWAPQPAFAVGLMIIAAAPGGVTSNLLTRFAGGDTALSVSLTAVISLASIVTVPLIVFFALNYFVGDSATTDLSLTGMALTMFAIVAVPVALGMVARGLAPGFAGRIEPVARVTSGLLFALVLAAAIWVERANITTYFAQAGIATLALNITMMTIAFLGAWLIGSRRPQRIALSLECGLQNGTLALAVIATLGLGSAYTVPAAIYSLLMFGTALIFVTVINRVRSGSAGKMRG
jgi:BASS family bile acid:Na+ symporter